MLTKVQELKLVARCVAFDDRNAFKSLVDEYKGPLNRFLLNLTGGDAALTDDLSQEAFLKSWLSLRSFKGIAGFKTWLFKIAHNEYISYMRRHHEDMTGLCQVNPATESDTISTEISIDLQSAISMLSPKERSIVLLFYLEDLPVKKVVEITGMPEGTVKVYLSRAREKLSQFLKDRNS